MECLGHRSGLRGRHGIGNAVDDQRRGLVLDMYDPTTKQLVWQGTATKTINPSGNQEKNEKNLNKAMEKLLKGFPPK